MTGDPGMAAQLGDGRTAPASHEVHVDLMGGQRFGVILHPGTAPRSPRTTTATRIDSRSSIEEPNDTAQPPVRRTTSPAHDRRRPHRGPRVPGPGRCRRLSRRLPRRAGALRRHHRRPGRPPPRLPRLAARSRPQRAVRQRPDGRPPGGRAADRDRNGPGAATPGCQRQPARPWPRRLCLRPGAAGGPLARAPPGDPRSQRRAGNRQPPAGAAGPPDLSRQRRRGARVLGPPAARHRPPGARRASPSWARCRACRPSATGRCACSS